MNRVICSIVLSHSAATGKELKALAGARRGVELRFGVQQLGKN
jgi:hypothetical protein